MTRATNPIAGPDIDDPTGVTVVGNVIAPNDARCCPSLKPTMRYRVMNGGIVPAGCVAIPVGRSPSG